MPSSTSQVEELSEYDRGVLEAIQVVCVWSTDSLTAEPNYEIVRHLLDECSHTDPVLMKLWPNFERKLALALTPTSTNRKNPNSSWTFGLWLAAKYRKAYMVDSMLKMLTAKHRHETFFSYELETLHKVKQQIEAETALAAANDKPRMD